MTTIELIEKLHGLGVEVQAIGDRLKIDAPAGIVTPELKSVIVERKPEILEILATFRAGSIVRPVPVRFNIENPPAECLMDNCTGGELLARGSLFVCAACGVWYSNAGALSTADQLSLTDRTAIREDAGKQTRETAEKQAAFEFENISGTVH